MKISYFLIAKYAEQTTSHGTSIVGGGLDIILVADLPHLFPSLFAVGKIIFDRQDPQLEHTLSVRLLDPSGELMSETEIKSFTVPDIPEGRDYIALSFALGFFALVFLHEGPHHVELICDGTPRQSVRFRVDRKPTNVAPNQGEHTTRGV